MADRGSPLVRSTCAASVVGGHRTLTLIGYYGRPRPSPEGEGPPSSGCPFGFFLALELVAQLT
jgi:hypothetical protein